MGLVSFVLTLPLAPVRGVMSLARVLEQRANEELYDPARVRRRLEEIEEAVASGQMNRKEAERAQHRVLAPVVAPVSPGGSADAGPDAGANSEPASGGGRPESTGSDFVTVRGEDEDEDRDATGNDFVTVRGEHGGDGGKPGDGKPTGAGNDFVTLRTDDEGHQPDPTSET